MRLSLLLKREPFGTILEDTMSDFWSTDGLRSEIEWGRANSAKQVWRGNVYLNYFCVDNVKPPCFEIIKREYGRSQRPTKRLLQSAYVYAATHSSTRKWLSQVQFSVSPPVPEAEEKLLIGGNRRMRIIHPVANKSYVIQKKGFSRLGFEREITARKGVAAALAPTFYEVHADGNSFTEAYFSGTPANRLPLKKQISFRQRACDLLNEKVHCPTCTTTTLADYITSLQLRIEQTARPLADSMKPLTHWLKKAAGKTELGLVLSHGDFQDANILTNGDALHIIDWENATERSQLYDFATISSRCRFSQNPVQAWRAQVVKWLDRPKYFPRLLVPPRSRSEILALSAVWWIEEAIFRLEDAQISSFANTNVSIAEQCAQMAAIYTKARLLTP